MTAENPLAAIAHAVLADTGIAAATVLAHLETTLATAKRHAKMLIVAGFATIGRSPRPAGYRDLGTSATVTYHDLISRKLITDAAIIEALGARGALGRSITLRQMTHDYSMQFLTQTGASGDRGATVHAPTAYARHVYVTYRQASGARGAASASRPAAAAHAASGLQSISSAGLTLAIAAIVVGILAYEFGVAPEHAVDMVMAFLRGDSA